MPIQESLKNNANEKTNNYSLVVKMAKAILVNQAQRAEVGSRTAVIVKMAEARRS